MPDRPCIRCRILHGINETCNQAKARVAKAALRRRKQQPAPTVPVYDAAIDNPSGRSHDEAIALKNAEAKRAWERKHGKPIGPDAPARKPKAATKAAPAKKARKAK